VDNFLGLVSMSDFSGLTGDVLRESVGSPVSSLL
jgi:hypothetical protein